MSPGDDTLRHLDRRRGLALERPASWILEEDPEPDVEGLMLWAPEEEGDWQAYVLLELAVPPPGRSLGAMLLDLGRSYAAVHGDFSLLRRGLVEHASGVPAGELVYRHRKEGLLLRTRQLLLVPAPDRALFAEGCSLDALWPRYGPTFDRILESIRVL